MAKRRLVSKVVTDSIKEEYLRGRSLEELSSIYNIKENTIKCWIYRHDWKNLKGSLVDGYQESINTLIQFIESKAFEFIPENVSQALFELKKIKKQSMSYIYFVQDNLTKFIKIGFSTQFEKRLKSLSTACPGDLLLLGLIPNKDMEFEKMLHEKFKEYKLKGEWFKPDDSILNYIRKHKE